MSGLSGYEIAVLSDAAAIPNLLASSGLERTPFQSPAWFDVWFSIFQPAGMDCHLGVIRKSEGGQPLFLLPLVRERRCGITVLTLPDRGISDYHAALVSPEFTPDGDTMDRLWGALVAMLPPADILSIERVLPESAARMRLSHLMHPSRFSAHALPIDADFPTIREHRFDPSTGRRLAKNRRKLENKGRLEFDFVSGPEALPELDHLLEWRRQRFQEMNDDSETVVQLAFYRRLVEQGTLARIGRLRLDGELVGGCLGLVEGNRILLLAVAYNKAFANWAPGLLTLESCLIAAEEMGLAIFDLTIGDETYKQFFGADTVGLLELCQPLSLRGRLALAIVALKPKLKTALAKAGLLELVQRLRGKRPAKR
ncbi:GNAT family N-acetyltransferase [Pleomorphomonas sp. JP5]|uniref:GNAT family N-acetyltransferase n=1 Tax=Pleomorphomonas sp. JP5 TaxID=2942998 RepID=UPI002044004F|nr:GNAT family N-acetyltransferase [Pleomorphomonas sp. JP5]MCM5558328.1 GNAT family N-acetyltransferase [Pleomorphomonas sp. JP5]